MPVVEAKNTRLRVWLTYLFLAVFVLFMIYPLLSMLSISFRAGDMLHGPLIPEKPTLDHWRLVFGIPIESDPDRIHRLPVLTWAWNSFKIGFISASITLVFSSMAAYAFARIKFFGSRWLLTSLMIIGMFPAITGFVAVRVMLEKLGILLPAFSVGSHGALVLIYLGSVLGEIWLIKGYIESLDPALEEAATMDGASRWQILRYIVLPLCLPILAVTFTLSFAAAFGEIAFANMLLNDTEKYTLAVGMKMFQLPQNLLWGDFAATAIFAALPIAMVFLFSQRWLIAGLTSGGVKG